MPTKSCVSSHTHTWWASSFGVPRAMARTLDAARVCTLLSKQGAQCLISAQDAQGATALYSVSQNGHASMTAELIAARCNVHLESEDGLTRALRGEEPVQQLKT